MQLFATILDNIHDYGIRKDDYPKEKRNNIQIVNNNSTKTTLTFEVNFNSGIMMNFLILSILQEKVRTIIGLNIDQHYLKSEKDCELNSYVKKNTNLQVNDKIAVKICQDFIFPTYYDKHTKIIYNSSKTEQTLREIVYEYIRLASTIDYSSGDIDDIVNYKNAIFYPQPDDTIGYVLGEDKTITSEFLNNLNLDSQKYIYSIYLGKFYIDPKKTKPSVFYGFFTKDKREKNSLAVDLTFELQAKNINFMIRKCCYWNDNTQLIFITDENKLDNEIFSKGNNIHYKGIFQSYDTGSTSGNTQSGGAITRRNRGNITNKNSFITDNDFENFQYILKKSDNELIFFDELGVCYYEEKYIIYHGYGVGDKNKKTIDVTKKSSGLTLFRNLINEINKKTLGVLNMKTDVKIALKNQIETVGIKTLENIYNISLKLDSFNNKTNTLVLEREEFILALFDLKRSMDYLMVKATYEANNNATKKGEDKKYIFVSSDRSAIYYALLQDVPCVFTTMSTKYHDKLIKIYRPRVEPLSKQQTVNKNNALLQRSQASTNTTNLLQRSQASTNTTNLLQRSQASTDTKNLRPSAYTTNLRQPPQIRTNNASTSPGLDTTVSPNATKFLQNTSARRQQYYPLSNTNNRSKTNNLSPSKQALPSLDSAIKQKIDDKSVIALSNWITLGNKKCYTRPPDKLRLLLLNEYIDINDKNDLYKFVQIIEYIVEKIKPVYPKITVESIVASWSITCGVPNLKDVYNKQSGGLTFNNKKFVANDVTTNAIKSRLAPSNSQVSSQNKRIQNLRASTETNMHRQIASLTSFVQKNASNGTDIYDIALPIDDSLINHPTHPEFGKFLTMYARLSPTITFFWFVVFESMFYFMDKTGTVKFFER